MREGPIVIGGEESGGLSIGTHIPEKDGILACLLVAEMRAQTGKSLHTLLGELMQEVGSSFSKRIDIHYEDHQKKAVIEGLKGKPPVRVGGHPVDQVLGIDGVKVILTDGSWFLVRASGTDDALDESAPLRPLTAYAESKVRAEEGLFALAVADFAPVSMRNATVFGASPRLRLDIVLNNLTAWAHTTGRIRLLSDGTAWRPLVHVRDLAKTALALLDAPEDRIRGEAFNVGTDAQNYLVRDLAQIVSRVTGCAVEMAEGSSADDRSYRVEFSKLRAAFPDLSFDWDAERGARELAEAYRAVGLTEAEFEGDRYVRLRRLESLLEANELSTDLRRGAETAPAASA
jgi:hypothetical protein